VNKFVVLSDCRRHPGVHFGLILVLKMTMTDTTAAARTEENAVAEMNKIMREAQKSKAVRDETR
jgi:hypothetical protein